MSPYAFDQDDGNLVAHLRLYPIGIAFYVEYHSVVAQKTGTWIPCLYLSRATPIGLLNFENPSIERATDVGVLLGEF